MKTNLITTKDQKSVLLKIGNEENVRDLLKNGTVYCKPLKYFQELEDGKIRGDDEEGVRIRHNFYNQPLRELEIRPKDGTRSVKFTQGNSPGLTLRNFHFKEYHPEQKVNMYCMYAVPEEEVERKYFFMNIKCLKLGTHFLYIRNNPEFRRRFDEALRKLKFNFLAGRVNYYYPLLYNGDNLGLLDKDIEYAWQREFRYVIYSGLTDPLIVKLGSLEDIAEMRTFDHAMKVES